MCAPNSATISASAVQAEFDRTYRQNTQRLIRWAGRSGWVSNKASVEAAWRPFLMPWPAISEPTPPLSTMLSEIADSVRFTSADIDDWGETMLQAGRQYRSVRQGKWNFRKALADAGLDCLLPKLKPARKKSAYRVPVNELPEPLASELKEILRSKPAKFAKGRPQWYRLRAISARISRAICVACLGLQRISPGSLASRRWRPSSPRKYYQLLSNGH